MKIRAHYDPKPIPDRRFDWTATDEDTYDGAPDSGTRGQIGYGRAEQEAIADLLVEHLGESLEGRRVRLIRPVDRFPFFLAPIGATATVIDVTPDLIRARLDEPLPGAGEWDNCIHWEAQGETLTDFALDCEEVE